MATQPTTQTLQSVHPIPNRIPVFIPDPLVADLAEMYAAIGGQRAMSFYKFVSQLVVDHIVRYRSMRIKPTSAVSAFDEEGEAAEQTEDNYIHKRALTPEQAQTVLHLRFSQGMSVANIAARLNRS